MGRRDTRTTTQRGLGYAHQKARAQAVIALKDGTPCPRCGQPMWRNQARYLDLDHIIPRSMGGGDGPKVLTHRRCNRRAGQRITAMILRARRRKYNRW